MKKSRATKMILTVVGMAAVAGAVPSEAKACGGAWYPAMMEVEPEIDHRIHGVPIAEDSLEEGNVVAAAGRIIRMMPHIKTLSPKSAKIVERAQRILAVAVVRQGGALDADRELPDAIEGTWLGKTPEHRSENLAWAVGILRDVSKLRDQDPMSQTELAEGLARTESGKKEAREILEKLAKRDLITSPEGYKALAELRRAAGDARGERLAMQRCEKMAKNGATCTSRAS